MSRKSVNELPRFVEPVKKGRYLLIIFVLVLALGALGFFYLQVDSENSDLKSKLDRIENVTTTTTTLPKVTTTTIPDSAIAKIDVIARNNDSNKTTTRINEDFEGEVVVTQVPSETGIASTVLVVNNPAFEELAGKIAEALGGTLGLVPEGQEASVADIVIYVKS